MTQPTPVKQQARTRAVLAALGIPVWAARSESVQQVPAMQVWGKREDESADVPVISSEPFIEAPQSVVSHAVVQAVVNVPLAPIKEAEQTVQTVTRIAPHSPPASFGTTIDVPQNDKPTRQPFTQAIAVSEAVHVEQVLHFSLEARVIGEWVVLVSVQALNHPERSALWKNINQAFANSATESTTVSRLDWPLAEGARWQHNHGAQAALMGFLTRFGTTRRIGLMGELPDLVIPERLERLPSLDELLQEPLKKRSLWRLLAGIVR